MCMNSMKFVIPLHLISWIKIPNDAVTPLRQSQFTPKMKANAVPRLLSSLVWIDHYNECNGMTSFIEFMKKLLWMENLRFRNCCPPLEGFAPPGNFPSYATVCLRPDGFTVCMTISSCSLQPKQSTIRPHKDHKRLCYGYSIVWYDYFSIICYLKHHWDPLSKIKH